MPPVAPRSGSARGHRSGLRAAAGALARTHSETGLKKLGLWAFAEVFTKLSLERVKKTRATAAKAEKMGVSDDRPQREAAQVEPGAFAGDGAGEYRGHLCGNQPVHQVHPIILH